MSSVAIANQILNLQKSEDSQNQGKKGRPLNTGNQRKLSLTDTNMKGKQQKQQNSTFDAFDGVKQNPLFTENPGFGPGPEQEKKEDNFSYYRQNENINTIKIKKKNVGDSNKPLNGEKTAASDVIDEFKQKYMHGSKNGTTLNNAAPKLEPSQQQKYFSKISPRKENANHDFSFISMDFEEPTEQKPKQSKPPKVEEVIERNRDFNVDNVLNDYKSKRIYKGNEQKIIEKNSNEGIAKSKIIEEEERRRNEQLNAKLSGFVYTPHTNPTSNNIYQPLQNIQNGDDIYGGNEGLQSIDINTHDNQQNKPTDEFNAWNAFRPQKEQKNVKKATYITKQPHDFHFGVKEDDIPYAPEGSKNNNSNKSFEAMEYSTTKPRETSQREFPELQRDQRDFPELTKQEEKIKQDFSIDEVLNGYKSKHVYKGDEKKPQEKHEAIIVKEQLEQRNKQNLERERLRHETLNARLTGATVVKKEYTSVQSSPMEIQESLAPSTMEVQNWTAPKNQQSFHETYFPINTMESHQNNKMPSKRSESNKRDHASSSVDSMDYSKPAKHQPPRISPRRKDEPFIHNVNHTQTRERPVTHIEPKKTEYLQSRPPETYNREQNNTQSRTQTRERPVTHIEPKKTEYLQSRAPETRIRERSNTQSRIQTHERPVTHIEPIKTEYLQSRAPETRMRSGSHRDNDGWVRATAQEKVNPGPTTQALDYFIRTPNLPRSIGADSEYSHEQRTKRVQKNSAKEYNTVINSIPFDENNNDSDGFNLKREDSSGSNPNVTFGQKNGKEIADEFNHFDDYDNNLMDMSTHSQDAYQQDQNRIGNMKSKSEPNLYTKKDQTTELDQLNFTSMSSKLRRSRISANSGVPSYEIPIRKEIRNTHVGRRDNYLVVDNSQQSIERIQSNRSKSAQSRSGRSSVTSFTSNVSHTTNPDKNRTTVMLARGWSGKIVSSSQETTQKYDYGVNIPNHSDQNVNAVVFRNKNPIEHIKPTDRNEDALNRLNSLDRRLKNENGDTRITSMETMDWMVRSAPSSPRLTKEKAHFYRESRYPLSDMSLLCENIIQSGQKEGQNMRVNFYEYLYKITAVVNEIVQALPKKLFPFKITPCSYQGDFEKKGSYNIDLYLKIEDLKEFHHQVNFMIKKELYAYIILKSDNKEILKSFCARNRDSNDWVLSASRLMVVFAYLINTQLRTQFEANSNDRRKKIPFDGQLKFEHVSEHDVRFDISFPGDNVKFNVGLLLALDVDDFPNIIDMNKKRTWPESSVKAEFIKTGVHLVAKPGNVRNHAWGVSFLKTRKVLLNLCDGNQTATSILLALQVVNKTGLSNRGCDGLLLPAHFIMILFWMHEKHRDQSEWNKEDMGRRLIDMIIALKRCLERKLCPDFFFPVKNYFREFTNEKRDHLLMNVEDVLSNPRAFLGLDMQQHRVSTVENQ